MNNKSLGIIAIIVIILAIVVGVFAFSGVLTPKTEIDAKFIAGTIPGAAVKSNESSGFPNEWYVFYNDTQKGIGYEFLAINNSSFMINYMEDEGIKKIGTESYNGIQWDIYYWDSDSSGNISDSIMGVGSGYFCLTTKDGIDYWVSVGTTNGVNDISSLNSSFFNDYTKPLLESITLKNASDAPKMYELFNMTESEFNNVLTYMEIFNIIN